MLLTPLSLLLCLAVLLFSPSLATPAVSGVPHAVVLTVKGAIGPAVGDYVEKGLKKTAYCSLFNSGNNTYLSRVYSLAYRPYLYNTE